MEDILGPDVERRNVVLSAEVTIRTLQGVRIYRGQFDCLKNKLTPIQASHNTRTCTSAKEPQDLSKT